MRLDFNQKGSWRKGPEFDERDLGLMQDLAEAMADLVDSKLRIIGEVGEVRLYREPGGIWWMPGDNR